jgi:hypothetical protein
MAAFDPEVQSDVNDNDTPGPNPAESDAHKVSGLQSYHSDHTNHDAPEEDDNPVSQVTLANLELGKEWKPHNRGDALKARRNSLLGNLRCLQARMGAHREKIGLVLARLMDGPRLRDKEVRKRESDKLSNNHRILVNLISGSTLSQSCSKPTVDTNLAFFTMAWLAVCQVKELESTTHEVLSDMEERLVSQTKEFERPSQDRPIKDCQSSESAVRASNYEVGTARSGGEGALATW